MSVYADDTVSDNGDPMPFGTETVGIVDESEGGVVAYVHVAHAEAFVQAWSDYTRES